MKIGWSGTSETELEQAVMYNLGMSHIISNSFLSFLSKALAVILSYIHQK
jgi:hypothetical protein